MNLDKISAGRDIPNDLNVIIEIPEGSNVKYEIEKESGAVVVDRFVAMPMYYPANYGFINETLADDGDPTDVLVITPQPIAPGSVIRCRPIGVLNMEDESGIDEKIIAVPHTKVCKIYDNVKETEDLPKLLVEQIKAFFENYKNLEDDKWLKLLVGKTQSLQNEKLKNILNNIKANF